MSARERLTQLVDLASGSALEARRRLALELTELLSTWPADYPAQMQTPFVLLLDKLVSRLDADTRREIAARFASEPAAPLSLLCELFLDANSDGRKAILARLDQETVNSEPAAARVEESALTEAVRRYPRDTFVQELSRVLDIPVSTAGRILADPSGEALAMLCKGVHLSRTMFSTIALLTDVSPDSAEQKLEQFESVSPRISARFVQHWRSRNAMSAAAGIEAA